MKYLRFISMLLLLSGVSNTFSQSKPTFQGMLQYKSSKVSHDNEGERKVDSINIIFNKEKIMFDSLKLSGTVMRLIIDINEKIIYAIDLQGGAKMAIKMNFDFLKKFIAKGIEKKDKSTEALDRIKDYKLKYGNSRVTQNIVGYKCTEVLIMGMNIKDKSIKTDTLVMWMAANSGVKMEDYAPVLEILKGLEGFNNIELSLPTLPKEVKQGLPVRMINRDGYGNEPLTITLQKMEITDKYAPLFDLSSFQIMDMSKMTMPEGDGN